MISEYRYCKRCTKRKHVNRFGDQMRKGLRVRRFVCKDCYRTDYQLKYRAKHGLPLDMPVMSPRERAIKASHIHRAKVTPDYYREIKKFDTHIGENHPRAKVTTVQVRALRDRVAAGEKMSKVAKELGINSSNARNIIKRKSWNHIP